MDAATLVGVLLSRGFTLAVAESLTGGLLTAEFVTVPGASAVLFGGIVAYNTEVKASLVGVDRELLDRHGAVHPEVARQLADRVRAALAVDGRSADIGLSTTGVAGPDSQDGHPVGTVFVGIALDSRTDVVELTLSGSRAEIRSQTVTAALDALAARI